MLHVLRRCSLCKCHLSVALRGFSGSISESEGVRGVAHEEDDDEALAAIVAVREELKKSVLGSWCTILGLPDVGRGGGV